MKNTYPLFLVYGLSCSGKTALVPTVRKIMGIGYNVYDMDSIVIDQDFQSASRNWVEISISNALSGNITVLFGSIPSPYDIGRIDSLHWFSPIYSLLLHCNATVRTERLRSRGTWTEAGIQSTIIAANEMYVQADYANLPIIDTSDIEIAEAAEQIKLWVFGKKGKE